MKRWVSILLALLLVLAAVPAFVHAEEDGEKQTVNPLDYSLEEDDPPADDTMPTGSPLDYSLEEDDPPADDTTPTGSPLDYSLEEDDSPADDTTPTGSPLDNSLEEDEDVSGTPEKGDRIIGEDKNNDPASSGNGQNSDPASSGNKQGGDRGGTAMRSSGPLRGPAATYTVKFDPNGGAGDMPEVTDAPASYSAPECAFTKTGHVFDGWTIQGGDDTKYQPEDSIALTGETTLVAQWKWAQGTISVETYIFENDTYRNAWQAPFGGYPGWASGVNWRGNTIELKDASGTPLDTTQTVSSSIGPAKFEGLTEGVYQVTFAADVPLYIIQQVGTAPGTNAKDFTVEVTIGPGSSSGSVRWAVIYKAFALSTTTDIGTFENGTTTKQYYTGEQYYTEKDGSKYTSHNGILYGDSPDLYSGMNAFEVPTLNEEEAAKGYTFKGWLDPKSGKVLSETQALSTIIYDNTVYEAVWEYPTHTVKFSTNTEYGTIDDKASYSYDVEYNNQTVTEIPTIKAKDGYEFIGWFTDHTTNVLPDSEIKATVVDRDLNFYAKYKRKIPTNTVKYVPGADGTLTGRDSLTVRTGGFIPTIPTVNPNEGKTFAQKWKVVSVSDGCEALAVGDVLNEVQISRLQIEFDVIFEALYDGAPTATSAPGADPTASPAPGSDPTATPASTATPKPTKKPDKDVPQTADNAQMGLWIAAFALALGGTVMLTRKRKKVSR